MPDITMCMGTGCKNKNTCYRYTAEPTSYVDDKGVKQIYQSYFGVVPVDKNGKCEHYWRVSEQKKRSISA